MTAHRLLYFIRQFCMARMSVRIMNPEGVSVSLEYRKEKKWFEELETTRAPGAACDTWDCTKKLVPPDSVRVRGFGGDSWNDDVPGIFVTSCRESWNDDVPGFYVTYRELVHSSPTGRCSPLQQLVNELSPRWRMTSRKTDGQEYVWVAINAIHPRVGPAPPRPDKRTDKTFSNGVLQDHDWSTTPDYWDNLRPYRAYIPALPNTRLFPDSSWIVTAWPLGSDWGVSESGGWRLSSEMRTKLLATRANANTLVGAIISAYKPRYIIPAELRLGWIDSSFPSEEALSAPVGDARRHILDQYGFIVYNLRQDPHWRTRSSLQGHVLRVANTGLEFCWHVGCIVDFKRMEFSVSELHDLISCGVPVHYQWFPNDGGPFDPRALGASDYNFLQKIRQNQPEWQRSTTAQSANPTDSPTVPPPAQKKAKYFKASGRFNTDKWEEISKNAYKELSKWCAAERVKLPTREVFVAYEYEGDDEEDVAPVGSVSTKEMAAYVLGLAAQPKVSFSTPAFKNLETDEPMKPISASSSSSSSATPAVTTGGSSSSAHHKPAHVAKDSLPVVTSTESSSDSPYVAISTAVPSSSENIKSESSLAVSASIAVNASSEKQHQGQRPATMCTETAPNIDILTRSISPGVESAVSLGEEDEAFCSFGSTPSLRPSSPGISVPPPASLATVAAVGNHNPRNERTYQQESNRSWHHDRDDSDRRRPVRRDFNALLIENNRRDDRHSYNDGYRRRRNHSGAYPMPMAHGRPAGPIVSSSLYPRSYVTSSSSRLPLPHHQECSAFPDDNSCSSRKRTISSVSLPSRAEENKRPRVAAPPTSSRPTLMDRLRDVVAFPTALPPTLMDRIHDVATFPMASPPVPEPSPPQQLPSAQVQILPVLAEVGLPLIAESYQANELQIDEPVFMTGITFPAAPVLRSGRLTTTFRSAIRVVYDQLSNPNASPADTISTLLRSGAPFRVLAPLPNTAPQQLAVAPSYLLRRNVFQGFDLKNPGYWNIYTSRVSDLLRRPFARRFLTLGGIMWRIALQFGPNMLVQEALAGPSSAVTLWGSGESVGNLWDDFVTPEEIDTLLGRSRSGPESCWPPNDLWGSSKKWRGFWSDADEMWFQSHLANLSSGNLQAPKSRRTWKTCFRPAKSDAPSEIYAQELFRKLGYDIVCAPTWDL
ncbi:hypothetical protein BDR07DRAFT_1382270 [Suillus spraguei]|nr:hypothetical protein BDR07DRAFT_1382270 [Suillus spraguei]